MKKYFLIMLALGISITIIPLAIAQTPDGIPADEETICDGLTGSAYGLCNAYCQAQDCDLGFDTKSCESLRKNYAKHTGTDIFPCDVPTACCFCSTGAQDPTGQGCEDISESACSARGGMLVGDYLCEEVGCTIESDDPGCLIVDNDPEDPIIPACINGISDVYVPWPPVLGWLCPYLGGELMDDPCPGVPLCEDF